MSSKNTAPISSVADFILDELASDNLAAAAGVPAIETDTTTYLRQDTEKGDTSNDLALSIGMPMMEKNKPLVEAVARSVSPFGNGEQLGITIAWKKSTGEPVALLGIQTPKGIRIIAELIDPEQDINDSYAAATVPE